MYILMIGSLPQIESVHGTGGLDRKPCSIWQVICEGELYRSGIYCQIGKRLSMEWQLRHYANDWTRAA